MYYKLGQAFVTNWGSFVSSQIRAKNNYKLGQLNYYKLGQVLLQIRATVITK